MILVDHEYAHVVEGYKGNIQVVVSHDNGQSGDPYEDFLTGGRGHSRERGWLGLEMEPDENSAATLCYTYVITPIIIKPTHGMPLRSGTTGRVRSHQPNLKLGFRC